jgi:hypothetical protein
LNGSLLSSHSWFGYDEESKSPKLSQLLEPKEFEKAVAEAGCSSYSSCSGYISKAGTLTFDINS